MSAAYTDEELRELLAKEVAAFQSAEAWETEFEKLRSGDIAIAIPARCALSALRTVAGRKDEEDFVLLRRAVKIADEASVEWDRAPEGMRAGKILTALAGRAPGYRADIDEIHAALKSPSSPSAERMRKALEDVTAERDRLRDVLTWTEQNCPGKCAGPISKALQPGKEGGE